MKHTVIWLLMLAFLPNVSGQIFESPYRKKLSRAEKKADKALQDGADFVIDPIEQVPTNVQTLAAFAAADPTNWGKDLLLPDALRARITAECTYKVIVKVSDTGAPDHVALKQGQVPAANYTSTTSASDIQGHSTHVHGIIVADKLGICDALVDKGLVTHKAIKILSDDGSGSFNWVANSYAAERSDDKSRLDRGEYVVYNGSFGGGTAIIENVEAELKKSADLGVVFCFAAGNTGQSGVNYPGSGNHSITCGSLDQGLGRSSYSTYGPQVWASMPGRAINSTYKGQTYAILSGTSMATPFLSGAVAIAYSKWGPKLRGLERLKAYLAWCAKDLGPAGKDNEYGYGIELIQNILDRDPINTPGLPNDPPPPPVDTSLATLPYLDIELPGYKDVFWNSALEVDKSDFAARTFKVSGKGSKKANQNLALKKTPVHYVVRVKTSTGGVEKEAQKAQKMVDDFFANRGFQLLPKQDAAYAAYWSAYFLEMILQQTYRYEVDVVLATFKVGNQDIRLEAADLLHWPRR